MKTLIEKFIIKYLLKHYTMFTLDGKTVRVFSKDFYDDVVQPAIDSEWVKRKGANCRHTFKSII